MEMNLVICRQYLVLAAAMAVLAVGRADGETSPSSMAPFQGKNNSIYYSDKVNKTIETAEKKKFVPVKNVSNIRGKTLVVILQFVTSFGRSFICLRMGFALRMCMLHKNGNIICTSFISCSYKTFVNIF